MVLSESPDDEMQQFSGKTSCNEDDEEDFGGEALSPWSNENDSSSSSSRKVSSTCRPGQSSPVGVGGGTSSISAEDRRMRRQIANCNERRRMQSINAGFQALRSLLPKKDGEKMSKAAILQHTADLIHSLMSGQRSMDMMVSDAKKRKMEFDGDAEHSVSDYVKTIDELKDALDREHTIRVACQRELLELKAQLNISTAVSPVGSGELLLGQPRMELASPSSANPLLASSIAMLNSPLGPLLDHTPSGSPPLKLHHPFPQPPSSTSLVSSTPGFPASSTSFQQLQMLQSAASPSSSDSQSSPSPSQSHRNLQAILEAIRHLEGQQAANVATSSPAATHGGNVLVR
uniref:BHLH domain-containing protein n=1 Tax=Steinernema glaseri TaxID=37863 RepID=A0A1I7ZT81_9BILA